MHIATILNDHDDICGKTDQQIDRRDIDAGFPKRNNRSKYERIGESAHALNDVGNGKRKNHKKTDMHDQKILSRCFLYHSRVSVFFLYFLGPCNLRQGIKQAFPHTDIHSEYVLCKNLKK